MQLSLKELLIHFRYMVPRSRVRVNKCSKRRPLRIRKRGRGVRYNSGLSSARLRHAMEHYAYTLAFGGRSPGRFNLPQSSDPSIRFSFFI